MKEINEKQSNFARIEFWAATTIFVFLVFYHITDSLGDDWTRYYAPEKNIPFSFHFTCVLVRYVVLYLSFLVLNFIAIPRLVKQESIIQNIIIVITVFAAVGVMYGVTDTYLKNYFFNEYPTQDQAYEFIFRNSFLYAAWLLIIMGFYSIIKYTGIYLLSQADTLIAKYKMITKGGIAAFIIWMIILLIMIISDVYRVIVAGWGIVGPFSILLYWFSLNRLIPGSLGRKRPFLVYLGKTLLWLMLTYFPVTLILFLLIREVDHSFAVSFFNVVFQLLITLPLSWIVYRYMMKGNQEVYVLKKELGQSHANFDFLRSQINPHFLFNALNTIYGTALQEKADRTGEAVQKLGDMMRFMIHENMQETISLNREIEYLDNYISLQRLRTDADPMIRIDVHMDDQPHAAQIAPMLLIPFVENAFKHGISFREPSYIKVTLEVKDDVLYFDISNSKHPRPENDPEEGRNGIGLVNVKERLALLYKNKHELVIRETGKDFFVHLTLHLNGS
jgi:sensor histidine kinase YesM